MVEFGALELVTAIAALFGTGAYLLRDRDLVRIVLGIVIVSQAAVLTLIASGLTPGAAPTGDVGAPPKDCLELGIAVFEPPV